MFKKSGTKAQFRRRRVADEVETVVLEASKPKPTLSFQDTEEEEPALFVSKKKTKKKLYNNSAPTIAPPVDETARSGGAYDAASLASLKAAQTTAPPPRAIDDDEDEKDDPEDDDERRAKEARRQRASQRAMDATMEDVIQENQGSDDGPAVMEKEEDSDDEAMDSDDAIMFGARPPVSQLPDFVPLAGRSKADEEHRERWLRAGADVGDVDAPFLRDEALSQGAKRVGVIFDDDDDDEVAAWEQELADRGTRTFSAAANDLKPVLPLTRRRRPAMSEDLQRAAAFAEVDQHRADREARARQAQLDSQDCALAEASIDAAKAASSLAVLRRAHTILKAALDNQQQGEALQLALSQASDLARTLQDDDSDDAVYGLNLTSSHTTTVHRAPPTNGGLTSTSRTFDNADAAQRIRAGLGLLAS